MLAASHALVSELEWLHNQARMWFRECAARRRVHDPLNGPSRYSCLAPFGYTARHRSWTSRNGSVCDRLPTSGCLSHKNVSEGLKHTLIMVVSSFGGLYTRETLEQRNDDNGEALRPRIHVLLKERRIQRIAWAQQLAKTSWSSETRIGCP